MRAVAYRSAICTCTCTRTLAAAGACHGPLGQCLGAALPAARLLHQWCLSGRPAEPDARHDMQVRAAVKQLCHDLGPKAIAIVEAFGIPEHLLAAPIAADWVKYNAVDNQGELVGTHWQ